MAVEGAAAKARREYQKAWRAKNREKVKQYQESYWERKAQEMEEGKHGDTDSKG